MPTFQEETEETRPIVQMCSSHLLISNPRIYFGERNICTQSQIRIVILVSVADQVPIQFPCFTETSKIISCNLDAGCFFLYTP